MAVYYKSRRVMPFMNLKPLHILVVGGGIAGIMLALLSERRAFKVTLIEKSKEWRPVVGAITLTLNGVRLLKEIGLFPAIEARSNEIRNINIADEQGEILSSFNLDGYADYAKTVTILRHDLHNILLSHLHTTAVHLDTTFSSIENDDNKVKVTLSNGHQQYYDAVVGCDGINSTVRKAVFGKRSNKYAGYSSWRFIANNLPQPHSDTITEMWGNGKRFGIVPVSENSVHCFASVNTTKNYVAYSNISIAAFKNLFTDFGGPVPGIMASLEEGHELMYNDLEDVPLQKYHKGRVILMGDAAHGMTPNLTQGAALAIEDAFLLVNKLTHTSKVEKDLAAFHLERSKRVFAVQRKSNLLGRIGQLKTPALCGLRNFCWKNIPDKWIQNDLKNLLVSR